MAWTRDIACTVEPPAGVPRGAWRAASRVALAAIAVGLWVAQGGGPFGLSRDAQAARWSLLAQAGQERELLEQKLALLETYVASQAARRIVDSDNSEAKLLLGEARAEVGRARDALAGAALDQAAAAIDEGLRKISRAIGLLGKTASGGRGEKERQRYEARHREVRAYLDSISTAAAGEAAEGDRAKTLAAIEGSLSESGRLSEDGRYREANQALERAYWLVVGLVSSLYGGRTVVASLNFDTPEEELDYERRRNDSYEMLIKIRIGQEDTPAGLRQLAERLVEEGRSLRADAERQAEAGDYVSAIGTMERATGRFVQILRASGLSIPE